MVCLMEEVEVLGHRGFFGGFVICKPDQHRLPGLCRNNMDRLSRFLSCLTVVDPRVQGTGRAICTRTNVLCSSEESPQRMLLAFCRVSSIFELRFVNFVLTWK